MTTDERIARLEIHNRRLTWALAGLLIIAASALFLGRADGARDRVVTARGFVVVNRAGTELVRIGESDTGPGAILIRNSTGARVAQLDATEDLGGSLWLYDGTTMPRTIITTDAKLGAHAMFVDAEGNVAARLGDVGEGKGSLDIYRQGKHGAFLCIDPKLGSANLSLYDQEKRLMVSLYGTPEGEGRQFERKAE